MRKTISLKNNRSLTAAYSLSRQAEGRWLVFLPESGAEFHFGRRNEIKALLGPELANHFNYLVINKPGLTPTSLDPIAFERSFRRTTRIADAVSTLQAVVPASDKIYLIGYSEGAYLAPQIARHDARIQSVVMIGGGTRGWLKEELSNAKASLKKEVQSQIRRIEGQPRSTQKWNGFSYATWHSYRQDATLSAIKKLNVPMLSILGARDRVIDLKATLQDLRGLSRQKPLETRVLSTCGHSFAGHWSEVRRILGDFLKGR